MKVLFTFTILLMTTLIYSQYNYGLDVCGQDAKIEGKLYLDDFANNTIIGADAGISINPSSPILTNNSIIGFEAGTNLVDGFENTILGSGAGRDLVSGSRNTLLGRFSGLTTIGSGNTSIGTRAGFRTKNNSGNVFIGDWAAYNISGSNNVMIGQFVGSDPSFNTTIVSNGNIFIGNRAAQFELRSNLLYLENSNSSTPLIYGEFANDKAGINWDSSIPLPNTLSVNGTASKTSSGDWLANSDERLKKNIEYLSSKSMLEKLIEMKAVSYEWNDSSTGYDRPEAIQYGFIAQDLQEVWPENVSEDAQGYLQTAYGTYDHMYVEAIKELAKDNELIKDENQQIKMENQELRKEIEAIKEMLQSMSHN